MDSNKEVEIQFKPIRACKYCSHWVFKEERTYYSMDREFQSERHCFAGQCDILKEETGSYYQCEHFEVIK